MRTTISPTARTMYSLAWKKTAMLVIGLVLAMTSTSFGFKGGESAYEIEYKVTCNTCDVLYRNAEGKQETVKVTDAWSFKFNTSEGQYVFVGANNEDGSEVKVAINKNGQEILSDVSSNKLIIAKTGMILSYD